MQWVTIAELQSLTDPKMRQAREAQHFRQCVEQAKLEQAERHHAERLAAEREVVALQGQTVLERERLAGENALALATHQHGLEQAASLSAVIDAMLHTQLKTEETWGATVADTLRQVIVTEADTIRQERVKALEQRHLIERLTLENNLRLVEMACAHELQNQHVSFDKACDIVFRLVERALGLGPDSLQPEAVRAWVREAMAQGSSIT